MKNFIKILLFSNFSLYGAQIIENEPKILCSIISDDNQFQALKFTNNTIKIIHEEEVLKEFGNSEPIIFMKWLPDNTFVARTLNQTLQWESDPEILFNIANHYFHTNKSPDGYNKALAFYKKARNHPNLNHRLKTETRLNSGIILSERQNITTNDFSQAKYYFEQVIDNNSADKKLKIEAMFNLGKMLYLNFCFYPDQNQRQKKEFYVYAYKLFGQAINTIIEINSNKKKYIDMSWQSFDLRAKISKDLNIMYKYIT